MSGKRETCPCSVADMTVIPDDVGEDRRVENNHR